MADFSKCDQGLHPLINIMWVNLDHGQQKVVRWCPQCGAIVVDHDIDGRTIPGHYMKIELPEISKDRKKGG